MRGARSTIAALTALFWLFGFDVLPLGHMVFHDLLDDHHHHHGHTHHHADDDGDDTPSPVEHGEGSVAHRDLAAHVPPPTLPAVLEALVCEDPLYDFRETETPTCRQPRTTHARAPPSLTA